MPPLSSKIRNCKARYKILQQSDVKGIQKSSTKFKPISPSKQEKKVLIDVKLKNGRNALKTLLY